VAPAGGMGSRRRGRRGRLDLRQVTSVTRVERTQRTGTVRVAGKTLNLTAIGLPGGKSGLVGRSRTARPLGPPSFKLA
jgi:hypothetical protein